MDNFGMPVQRNNVSFAFYAAVSTLCAVSTVAYALHTRQQFYPTVRLSLPPLHSRVWLDHLLPPRVGERLVQARRTNAPRHTVPTTIPMP